MYVTVGVAPVSVIPETVSVMDVDDPAGSVFAVTVPLGEVTANPEPSVVVVSTFSEKVSTMVVSEVKSAVNVGAMPSEGVALPDVCGFPSTSLTEPTSVTSGVSPVPMAVPKVKVTTPESSDAALTVLLATVKSPAATVVASRSSENVTSIRVVVTVAAESNVGGIPSTVKE